MREASERAAHPRNHVPLAVRGSSTHTFRSLGFFAETGLLFCGSYLLAQPLLSPLKAGAISVIGGGLFLGLATILLFYLAWPTYANSVFRREQPGEQRAERFTNFEGEPLGRHKDRTWILEEEEELPGPM